MVALHTCQAANRCSMASGLLLVLPSGQLSPLPSSAAPRSSSAAYARFFSRCSMRSLNKEKSVRHDLLADFLEKLFYLSFHPNFSILFFRFHVFFSRFSQHKKEAVVSPRFFFKKTFSVFFSPLFFPTFFLNHERK